MSIPINDGGPAFPSRHVTKGSMGLCYEGMTLRDYFAAFALLGQMVRESTGKDKEFGPYTGRAETAYRQADAMLKERAETHG